MREATEASISINDFSEEFVEAFIQFLYTSVIPEGIHPANLLPLAHRYECKELLELCANDLLESISEQNCAEYAEILQPFEDDHQLGPCWTRFVERLVSDPALGKALLGSIHL